jgi:hypothetical protein
MIPSPAFVRPLQLGRLLPTPRHAARVVALLRSRDDDVHPASRLTGRTASGVRGTVLIARVCVCMCVFKCMCVYVRMMAVRHVCLLNSRGA